MAAAVSPLTSWTFDPIQLTGLALLGFVYYRRVRTLAERGTPVETWRQWSYGSGLVLLFIWVPFTLADARRAFRWAAIAAAVCPCASYVLCLAAGLLGGDSSGGGSVGLIGTYAVASLAVVTKER